MRRVFYLHMKYRLAFITSMIRQIFMEEEGMSWQYDSITRLLWSSNFVQRSYTIRKDLNARSMAEL